MTKFNYKRDIPFATNNPSVDQPNMQTNTNSIYDLINEDHVTFKQKNGGYHKVIHFINQSGDPVAIPGVGQLYTKTVSGDQELFYESGGGKITQLTNGTGVPFNTPVILQGSFVSTGSFTNISAIPANVYGYIIFRHTTGSPAITQLSSFVSNATRVFGGSSRIVDNGTSNDDPVELNNNNNALFLQGRSDDFGNHTWPWVIHYWFF